MTINQQSASDNAIINNADEINNNIYDDKLRFYCEKKISENPNLKSVICVLNYIVNKHNLKKRFSESDYKYEELLSNLESRKNFIDIDFLDDGYKSVITCIVKIVSYFTMDENDNVLNAYESLLLSEITNKGLRIYYSKEVNTFEKYNKAKIEAEKIVKEIHPYLNCATQYGNIFQFNHIYLDQIEDVPFLTEEVQFHVSNTIIPNLIKPLYGECPECGLREIMQNAFDASKELREYKGIKGENEKVELWIINEKDETKIRVRDYGIGMTEEVLLHSYFVIGESTKRNKGLGLVGQFGIGALAAFLLGETIEVRTKNYESQKLYHFIYTLHSNTIADNNINIAIEEDDEFLHGTEVTISLNSSLKNLSKQSLKSKLRLNEWYLLTDIPIEYHEMGELKELKSISGNQYHWETLKTENENIEFSYLIGEEAPKVILNGLMVPNEYVFNCKYLNIKPYISIKCRDDSIKLNLERSRIESGLDTYLNLLEKKLIGNGLEELKKDIVKIITEEQRIKYFVYDNRYLRNIPLFFFKNGLGVYSKNSLKRIEYEKVVEIYCSNRNFQLRLSDLENKIIYVFCGESINKNTITSLLDNSKQIYINNQIVKPFFYDATSQYNGFRKDLMQRIYEALGEKKPDISEANKFWTKHNIEKKELFEKYFSVKNFISIGDEIPQEIRKAMDVLEVYAIKVLAKDDMNSKLICDKIDYFETILPLDNV